jgi:hypothetical protein
MSGDGEKETESKNDFVRTGFSVKVDESLMEQLVWTKAIKQAMDIE